MSLFVRSVILLFVFTLVRAREITVYVTNHLERKKDLKFHCKSNNDDLGLHILHINQTFNWSFGSNFFSNTLFYCSFQWGDVPLLHFDTYDEKRDFDICSICQWLLVLMCLIQMYDLRNNMYFLISLYILLRRRRCYLFHLNKHVKL